MWGSSGRSDIALDVGTAVTRATSGERLAPLARPSMVWRAGRPHAALAGGVIADPAAAVDVIGELLRAARGRVARPSVLACIPTDASDAERAALADAVRAAGAHRIAIVAEPVAVAAAAGVETASSCIVVDVGEGVTDCAAIRGLDVVVSDAERVGVSDLRAAIQLAVEERHGLRIAGVEAERLLREVGVATWRRSAEALAVVARPLRGPGPVTARIDVAALHEAIEPVADRIVERIGRFVLSLPRELAEELDATGICLSGGGSLLRG